MVETGERKRVLVLEPYYGGSHRRFVEVLCEHGRHEYEVLSLPARKWKWRMRGAAIWFAEQLRSRAVGRPDVLLTCDMLSVADLRALLPASWQGVPIACYFHENQLTYPLSESDRRDYQFGFTNITSCLAADAVWFNSGSHRDAFFDAADALLRQMPDHVPWGSWRAVRGRAEVLWPPVEPPPGELRAAARKTDEPVTILWCHRWEYDKDPEAFFRVLFRLEAAGHDFRVVLLGESFREAPGVFGEAWERLRGRIVQAGYLPERRDYWTQLAGCDVVVSTAIQENFGISVVEAMLAGCWPVLPRRLSYPEVLPTSFGEACLYEDEEHLLELLSGLAANGVDPDRRAELTRQVSELHDVSRRTEAIEDALERFEWAGPRGCVG